MTNSVEIKNLDLNFGTVKVLKQLNLNIAEGEFLVLLGSSGCGKSTLLNCVAGLLDVTDGQIFIKGQNVTWAEPSDRGIGMVFQSYALYPQMTVRGNLSFGLKNAKVPKAEIKERVDQAAKVLQIEALLDRKPGALSGGQRQRVAIGRALVRDVDVFLFDEPLSNLDAKLRTDLRVELKRLHQKLKNTMIYVTHDQVEAMTLADRISIMKNGLIEQLDTPEMIYAKPCNKYVADFIGSPAMNLFTGQLKGTKFKSDGLSISAFHVKDAEFNATGKQGVYSGFADWTDRAGRFRSLGDGQVDFKGIFSKLTQYGFNGWAVLEWECCLKHPEQGASEGAPFIANHLIRQTERAFDDFAGGKSDPKALRKMMGF